jgi:hypothetical protein
VQALFFLYLLVWSYWVGTALINACGVAGTAFFPQLDPLQGKVLFGILHSVVALGVVWFGTYSRFEKIMSYSVGIMFVAVVVTALRIAPSWTSVLKGFIPQIPLYLDQAGVNQGPSWTLALMGGVGGTFTILCYGYWIQEKGRNRVEDLPLCRLDLAVAYGVTALFGMAMVIIASQTQLDKTASARMVVILADRLGEALGPSGKWIFLIGAWAAIFSSLLGVWQAVPYLFADFWRLSFRQNRENTVKIQSKPYQLYLLGLTFIPMIGLKYRFVFAQKIYAMLGAFVIPFLAILLLILNKRAFQSSPYKNRPAVQITLILIILLFILIGWPSIQSLF